MKKNKFTFKKTVSGNLHIKTRITASVLILAVIASAICSTIILAEKSAIVNYPALKGYSSGLPSDSTNWKYGIKNFAPVPNFINSTDGFSAPQVVWDANETKATLFWDSNASADAYVIKIYNEASLILEKEVSSNSYTTDADLLTGGESYSIQVTALSSKQIIEASDICIFTADAAVTNTVYSFGTDNNAILYADTLSEGKIINTVANTGYTLANNTNARRVVFHSKEADVYNYGSHLRFTAPEASVYDFAGSLYVLDNTAEATLYYRVIKIDENNGVIPLSGEDWLSYSITTADLNPRLEFPVVEAELKTGEAVAIEVYHTSSVNNSVLNISFDNPTATKVVNESTYKGNITTYCFEDYNVAAVYGTEGSANKKFSPVNGRWNSQAFIYDNNTTEYHDFNYMRSAWSLVYANGMASGVTTGYYYASGSKNNVTLGNNTGVSFQFVSPKSAYATISTVIPKNYKLNTVYYRILKNNSNVYPENTVWELVPANGAILTATTKVSKGDILSIEFYSPSDTKQTCLIETSPYVTLIDNSSNSVDSDTFSPLWERPYKNSQYSGEITVPNGAVWNFGLYNTEDAAVESVNYYDSTSRLLYKNGISDCGYIFCDEQLKFRFGDGQYGMSLDFTVPERNNYDLSFALNTLQGKGEVFVRLLKNSKTVFPENGEWHSYTASTESISALELSGEAGDIFTLQIYSKAVEDSEEIIIGLGTPVIKKLSNRIYTPTGNTTVYRPADYIAFEEDYYGEFIQLNSRFTYQFTDTTSKVPTLADSNELRLTASNGAVSFDGNGKITVNAVEGATAEIVFITPMSGNGTAELISDYLPDGAAVSICKNGESLFDWTRTPPQSTDITFKKGDRLIIKVKGLKGDSAVFSAINISIMGRHNNRNSAEDNGFYAVYANPYGDVYYVGDYEKTDSSFWSFDFYDVKNNEIKEANKYDVESDRKLYSSYLSTAYYFGNYNLTADMNRESDDENYGLSLGFTSPRKDVFNTRYGLSLEALESNQSSATLNARLIKFSASGGSTEQIWPLEAEWHSESLSLNDNIEIPYAEVELEKGDTIYLQIYATDCNGKVSVNLVSPAILKETVVDIVSTDISAKIYRAFDYCPYSHIQDYKGKYIPMDNRWNFYFANVDSATTEFGSLHATTVNTALLNSDQIYLNNYLAPLFKWNPNSKTVDVVSEITETSNTGALLTFTAPTTGEIIFSAPISILNSLIEDAQLKYRVVRRSIADGSTTTVWPDNGIDEWETLSQANSLSNCLDIPLQVDVGDVLELQTYWIADSVKITEYKASNQKEWQPSYSIPASITVIEEINSNRSIYNAAEQFMGEHLLNPFWRVQYTLDSNSPDWKNATLYKWTQWLSASEANIGISKASLFWIENESGFCQGRNPSVAWTFTSRKNGIFKYSNSTPMYLGRNTTDGYNAQARITLNGETVWPSSGWQTIISGERLKIKDLTFDIAEGDVLRFEVRADKEILIGEQLYLLWNPVFTIGDDIDIYNRSNDIYNMLDDEMLALFKSLSGDEEFDPDLAANKLLSEKIKQEKANIERFEYFSDNETEISDGSSQQGNGDYREWTEVTVKPGGKWKKIIRTYYTPWWVIALIVVGSVIGVAGVTVLTVIFVKKRRKMRILQGEQQI